MHILTACLREGLIHEWKQALLAPPLPLILLNNSRLCSTHKHRSASSLLHRSTDDILRIVVKAQPSTRSTGHGHLLGLAYNRKTWAYPMSTVLATVAFQLLVDTSLLSQGGFMHYSQQLTLQHSTKLYFVFYSYLFFINFFKVDLSFFSKFRPPHEGSRQATS